MTRSKRSGRHRWWLIAAGVAVLAVLAVTAGIVVLRRHAPEPYLHPIPGSDPRADSAWTPRRPQPPEPQNRQPAYVREISQDGRYFLDQRGQPILVQGDSPWSLLADLSADETETYLSERAGLGVNAMIMTAITVKSSGGRADTGATAEGLLPFVDRDVTALNGPYWTHVHDQLAAAASHGITVFFYLVDAWSLGRAFRPASVAQCESYGRQVAERLTDLPNIVWMAGGDYRPPDEPGGIDADHCINAAMRGVRGTGDSRLFSIQLEWMTSGDRAYWQPRVDWDFAYTYDPPYRQIAAARVSQPTRPVLLGESNYEGENNLEGTPPTTTETLRRQVLWSLTSGAAGDFYGSDIWRFERGWQDRLDRPGLAQIARLRDLFRRLPWWGMHPDLDNTFVTSGAGTFLGDNHSVDVLSNDFATSAISADRSTAVIYVPTARTLTVDLSRLKPGIQASWIDPASGREIAAGQGPSYTTPETNADGTSDWLLLFRGDPAPQGG